MQHTRAYMLERFMASDASADGEFLTGVVTTGIYCLPSCTARKPKAENVRFFATEEEARAAGLRPCKRCRPDHFYKGYDPDRQLIETVASEVRETPAAFENVRAVIDRAGVGATKLHALFRTYYHTTPAVFLQHQRVRHACRMLEDRQVDALEAAFAVGYESASSFYDNFRRYTGLSPGAYQRLGEQPAFTMTLPEGYLVPYTLARLGRDPESLTRRVYDNHVTNALYLDGRPALLHLELEASQVRCRVETDQAIGAEAMQAAHVVAVRLLGLHSEATAFERRLEAEDRLGRLIDGRRGLHVPLTTDVFEGVVWAIVGQQVNLAFAQALQRRLTELCGQPAGDGFLTPLTPAAVARLDYADLTPLQFSRRKAEYLIDIARQLEAEEVLQAWEAAPAPEVEDELLALRGIGPWSAHYVMMRACGFADCVPLGDTGLTSALQQFFDLDHRPGRDETTALMEPFAPFRTYATHHLWMTLKEEAA